MHEPVVGTTREAKGEEVLLRISYDLSAMVADQP